MISLAQMHISPGRPDKNLAAITQKIRQAADGGSELVVFPELAVPGYLLGDEWENTSFVRECEAMNEEIIATTKELAITAIWGNVQTDSQKKNEDGRMRKYNAAFVAKNGILLPGSLGNGANIKTLLPNYREFRDKRHFTSLQQVAFEAGKTIHELREYYQPFDMVIQGIKHRVGVIICEDMWDDDYAIKPVQIFRDNGADMIINISASPFWMGKQSKRERLLTRQSAWLDIFYTNNVGVQNNGKNVFVFDGASTAYSDGKKIFQAPSFEDGLFSLEVRSWNKKLSVGMPKKGGCSDSDEWEVSVSRASEKAEPIQEEEILAQALITGLRDFMAQIGQKKIVIGLSGGIDSAVVAVLAMLALGPENVVAINMPSDFNSQTTRGLAQKLAEELNIRYEIIPIQASVDLTKKQIEDTLSISTSWLIFENIQARDRGSRVLAGIAAALGAVFTNNGNKTEVSQWYATLYGDVNGSIAPIADLYKTQVFALARYFATKYHISSLTPICELPPSAELSSEQSVDEGKGDPFIFEYHDPLLFQFIELRQDPTDILRAYRDGKLQEKLGTKKKIVGADGYFPSKEDFIFDVERIWKNYKISYFKRIQAPPILTVSRRAFGYDLEESQNGVYFTKEYLQLKSEIIAK